MLFFNEFLLECIEDIGDGFLVHYGHVSEEPEGVTIPVGDDNRFSTGEMVERKISLLFLIPFFKNQGQPTFFTTGRSTYWPLSEFTVEWNGYSPHAWELAGIKLEASRLDITLQECPKDVSVLAVVDTELPEGATPVQYKRASQQTGKMNLQLFLSSFIFSSHFGWIRWIFR